MAPLTFSIFNHTKSNLRGGISNLRIFDINPATKFEYRGKSNLVAPDLPIVDARILLPHPSPSTQPLTFVMLQRRRSLSVVTRHSKLSSIGQIHTLVYLVFVHILRFYHRCIYHLVRAVMQPQRVMSLYPQSDRVHLDHHIECA